MTGFKQIISNANTEYIYSDNIDVLKNAYMTVEDVLAAKTSNEENRANGEALRMRLACKIFALEYFNGYDRKRIERLQAFVDENLPVAKQKEYKKSAAILSGTIAFLRAVSEFVKLENEMSALCESDGFLVAKGADAIADADALRNKADALCTLSPFSDIKFIDVKARLDEDISVLRLRLERAYIDVLESNVRAQKIEYSRYDYFPLPENDEGGKADAIILNTPFVDEARLYAAHAIKKGVELIEFDGATFDDADALSRAFALLEFKRCAALVTHIETLSENKRREFFVRCMTAGKRGLSVFTIDVTGGSLYDCALEAARGEDGLSALDISSTYITVPQFSAVCDELESLDIGSGIDRRDKLKEMPFLGFMGLNEITKPENSKNWHARGKKISDGNVSAANAYLSQIRAPMLFIDDGWGNFKSGRVFVDVDGGFDYDGVSEVDKENVRRLAESGASVFGKCGCIARYCTTGTGDISEWGKLGRDEMLERITLAVRLVLCVLRVPVEPVVELLDEIDNNTAGGLCYDGGKRIVFKYASSRNLDWLRGAIVHECFHALQAKLTRGGWSIWYYDNLGISRGRSCLWKETEDRSYDANTRSTVYKVHMYEADARAFEIDCADGHDKFWNTLDLD